MSAVSPAAFTGIATVVASSANAASPAVAVDAYAAATAVVYGPSATTSATTAITKAAAAATAGSIHVAEDVTFLHFHIEHFCCVSTGSETQRGSCYVKGRLQPTRAFGDFMLKNEKYIEELQRGRRRRPPCTSSSAAAAAEAAAGTAAAAAGTETWSFPYVIVDPQTQVFEKSEADQFVVVGTDGLWDFLSPAEAAAVVRSSLSSSSSSSGSTMTDLAKTAADA